MSLTGLLGEKGSPFRAIFRELLPDTSRFVRDLNRELTSFPLNTERPSDSGLSGTALDYRLRYYFAVTPPAETVAGRGAAAFNRKGVAAALTSYFRTADLAIEVAIEPVGRLLPDKQEIALCRHCVVLAYCEQFFRSGRSLLFDVASETGTLPKNLQELVPEDTVADVANVSRRFFEHQYPQLAGRSVVLNPTFDGSRDVGGADADIIAGDSLIEFKSTIRAQPIQGNDIYQLLGYACLDYSDAHHIRRVGFSMLRRDVLKEWDLGALVDELSGGKTQLPLLRDRVRAYATSLAEERPG
ncbi:MAG: hypothetical protein O3B31_06540 [Chloroflexi bacterium]|nr:hypothetical protein [Chloroflexota bacterium]